MIFRRKGPSEENDRSPGYGTDYVGGDVTDMSYSDSDYVDAEYVEQSTTEGRYAGSAASEREMSGAALSAPEELGRLRTEREALIELCLYARDRVNSRAAADRIDARLLDLGITSLRPDGEPFDPAQHEAAASVPTTNYDLHGTVAETEVPGYADRGKVVRPPVVAVYRREQP